MAHMSNDDTQAKRKPQSKRLRGESPNSDITSAQDSSFSQLQQENAALRQQIRELTSRLTRGRWVCPATPHGSPTSQAKPRSGSQDNAESAKVVYTEWQHACPGSETSAAFNGVEPQVIEGLEWRNVPVDRNQFLGETLSALISEPSLPWQQFWQNAS
eukprot:3265358-Amphidinium_carterae.2